MTKDLYLKQEAEDNEDEGEIDILREKEFFKEEESDEDENKMFAMLDIIQKNEYGETMTDSGIGSMIEP